MWVKKMSSWAMSSTWFMYDKNEFILKQAKENAELSEQITQTQIALTEVYEMMA